ncbi:MAG: hypothetical protein J6K48_08985 [Lachnospiraceae bacterium]|nr:hypothetical protein [Lachnospiraceae bacterium]
MNLLERNEHSEDMDWRDDIRDEKRKEPEDDIIDLGQEPDEEDMEEDETAGKLNGVASLLQKPYMTAVLLGIIVVLLVCIIVMLILMPSRRQNDQADSGADLNQSITEYAQEQKKQDDMRVDTVSDAIVVTPSKEQEVSDEDDKENTEDAKAEPTAEDDDKTAIVVDVEDENDVSYTKEYILNEALPYFADNNQDAIWDLAHLKRYVKLSKELEDTNSYYYQGDVDSEGKPDGVGLAIYEQNSYYYGEWSHGVRSGRGTWFRFYIQQKDKNNAMGKYMAHSYSGTWANNLPNGLGAEHYEVDISKLPAHDRILQNVIGNFTDGLYDGELYANTVDYTGNVEEWEGVASKGVFELWRDMSAIGECSVWRKMDDHSLCMDIDKSENKNQGIRELLK